MHSFFIYLKTRISAAILFTGLVYFVLSKSGMILAIPGTNASSIFPAAGFALSAVLLLGKRSLAGIFPLLSLLELEPLFRHTQDIFS